MLLPVPTPFLPQALARRVPVPVLPLGLPLPLAWLLPP